MKVMAQLAMVMNLDKCIGCHTCSVTCKQAWTNRSGTEYVWFNNVETRPGQGYPRTYEDQDRWRGGWVRDSRGRLRLRDGGRSRERDDAERTTREADRFARVQHVKRHRHAAHRRDGAREHVPRERGIVA